MKRFLFSLGTAFVLLLLLPNHAYAICQKCNNDNTLSAMCWTLTSCESGATMSACVVAEEIDPKTGQVASRHCDSQGTTQGSECNGADSSCSSGGGGGSGGGGTGGSGGNGNCVI